MNKILYWASRVLGVLVIIFISLFALDIFGQGYSFWQTVAGLLVHLIPSFALIITLLIAWKQERIGGVIYILLGLYYFYSMHDRILFKLPIAGPLLLLGILFLVQKKNKYI